MRKVPRKSYYVGLELMKRAYKYKKLDNLFEDDDSENYEVTFTNEQAIETAIFEYCTHQFFPGDKGPGGFDIYGVDIRKIEANCRYKGNAHDYVYTSWQTAIEDSKFIARFMGDQGKIVLNEHEKQVIKEIKTKIMLKYNYSNEGEVAKFLRDNYMIKMQKYWNSIQDFLAKQRHEQQIKDNIKIYGLFNVKNSVEALKLELNELNEIGRLIREKEAQQGKPIDTIKQQYNEIYEQLVKDGKAPLKWTSEFELYKLIKKYYKDAIFQYSPEWLFPQRFDIYVPSLGVAFEYQGIQHFKNVEFFGGEAGLKKRIELDAKKRYKSHKENVKVIDWMYNEPITKNNLQKKLELNDHII